jgi:hypothetical protein
MAKTHFDLYHYIASTDCVLYADRYEGLTLLIALKNASETPSGFMVILNKLNYYIYIVYVY